MSSADRVTAAAVVDGAGPGKTSPGVKSFTEGLAGGILAGRGPGREMDRAGEPQGGERGEGGGGGVKERAEFIRI